MTYEDQLLSFLKQYVSDNHQEAIEQKLASRTNFLTIVLEDIYNPHNANAVVRSCECFGIQQLHIIEERNEFQLSPNVLQGSSKWIDLKRYKEPGKKNILVCYEELRKNGYRIVATKPNPDSVSVKNMEISKPVALVFGTELNGLTESAIAEADEMVHIPMFGFTENFNISVSAALCMYEILGQIRSSDVPWQLEEKEKCNIRLDWHRKSVQRIDLLEEEFNKQFEQVK